MIDLIAITTTRDARKAGVEALAVKSVAAIVERRARAPKPTAPALKARIAALGRLEKRGLTLLPVRFGTMAATRSELEALLAPHARVLAAAVEHVRGRRQMTVHVRGTRVPHDRSSGAAYLASLVRGATLPEADGVRRAVAALVIDERVETSSRAGFIGAVHHLVDADDVDAYVTALSPVGRRPRGQFVVTGPMIPFAFAPPLGGSDDPS